MGSKILNNKAVWATPSYNGFFKEVNIAGVGTVNE